MSLSTLLGRRTLSRPESAACALALLPSGCYAPTGHWKEHQGLALCVASVATLYCARGIRAPAPQGEVKLLLELPAGSTLTGPLT